MSIVTVVALASFTHRQLGHVTCRQAASVGVSRRVLAGLYAAGVLDRPHRGVYRLEGVPPSDEGRLLAAVLAAGPGAVASHSWAAWLHRLGRVRRARLPEICVPGPTLPRMRGVVAHRTRSLEPCDVMRIQGIPTTSGSRTVVDLAGRLPVSQRMALADDAVCARITTRDWLHHRARALVAGRAGVGTLVWITAPGAEGIFWSWLERRFGQLIRRGGLPQPTFNVAVRDEDGLIGYADACWQRRLAVIAEVDGLRFHRMPAARRRDNQRTNRYALSGRIALRFTYEDVVEAPEAVLGQLRRALTRAS